MTDVVLLERQELTSGSSWHAAGSLFALTSPSNAAILQKYTIGLYPQLILGTINSTVLQMVQHLKF